MIRRQLKVQTGKTYTLKSGQSSYTILVGEMEEAATSGESSDTNSSNLHVGVGAPATSLGKIGGIYLDSLNKRVYVKDSIGWDSGFDMGGSGTGGSNGTNGRTTLEGSGPPSDSIVYAAALADAGISSSDVQNGDLFLDTLNQVFYKRASGSWVSRTSHKGRNGRTIFEGSGDPDDPASELPSDIGDAVEGDLYHDVTNFRWHRRNSSSTSGSMWDSRSVYLGSIGPIGPNGLDGNDGQNGRTTLEGDGPPSDALAYAAALSEAGISASDVQNGDLYLDTSNHVFYKRSSGSWVSRTSHKGKNGRTIFEGSGDPDDPASELPSDIGDAVTGDLYHDVTNFKWYRRNSSSTSGSMWDSRSTYLGPIGPVGPNGNNGDKGAAGDPGADGKNGVSAQLTNDSDVIPADSDGSGYDFTNTGGEFEIRSGGTKVSSGVTYYAGASGVSSTSAVNGLTLTINSSGAYSLSGASWSQNFARFTMRADYDGVTYTKVYKVTKARAGLRGSDGNNGNDGKDGTNGTDALTGHLSNEADVISAANDGTGYSLSGTGGTFYVYSGKTLVSPSNFFAGAIGTSTTQTISGLTLSVNSSGVYSLSGASWTSDSASFTLRAVYSGVTVTKTYKISKSKSGLNGTKGDPGDTGPTGPGVKVYSVSLGSDASSSDVQLTTSYADMYLADVMTNEGNILTASVTKGGASTFTINATGRYKIELQATFRLQNSLFDSTSYSSMAYARILKDGVSLGSGLVSMTATGHTSSVLATYDSGIVNIEKKVRLVAGTVLKVQAMTSTTSTGKRTFLELATDADAQTSEDTILTITKL